MDGGTAFFNFKETCHLEGVIAQHMDAINKETIDHYFSQLKDVMDTHTN